MSVPRKCAVDIFFGATKVTKTSQIGRAAQYFYEKFGKPTLLWSADNGGWEPIQSLVDAGIVDARGIREFPYAPEAIERLSQGWIWDEKIGKLKPAPIGFWDKYAMVAFEGLSSIGEWCMNYFQSSGTKLGMTQSFSGIKIGETTFNGVGQDHYGFIQDLLLRCVVNSAHIPVERVIWTSLEMRGIDVATKAPVFGPALVGNKKVDKAGQYFGNCIHLDLIETMEMDAKTKEQKLVTKPVMFLKPHLDPATKVPFYAGTRAPFDMYDQVPEFLDPPNAYKLYEMLDGLREKSLARIKPLTKVDVKVEVGKA